MHPKNLQVMDHYVAIKVVPFKNHTIRLVRRDIGESSIKYWLLSLVSLQKHIAQSP